jgi:hypothetical protein
MVPRDAYRVNPLVATMRGAAPLDERQQAEYRLPANACLSRIAITRSVDVELTVGRRSAYAPRAVRSRRRPTSILAVARPATLSRSRPAFVVAQTSRPG